jgi:hypothetical protein
MNQDISIPGGEREEIEDAKMVKLSLYRPGQAFRAPGG